VRNRVISLWLLFGMAAALWYATYVAAMVFAPFAVALAIVSLALLARCAWRRKAQDPSDVAGALALSVVALAFAVSMFLPLWGHTGFRYNEAGDQVLVRHTHGILDADHIH
jgi:apolipoprotein N-acyltransferase